MKPENKPTENKLFDEHKIKLTELYERVASSDLGLSDKEAALRLDKYGKNKFTVKNKTPAIFKFLKQFTNFFALLLMSGAVLAFIAEKISPGNGNLYIAIALAGVVVLNSIFTFIQEYQSEKIMDSFKNMLPESAQVIRSGKRTKIESLYLVPGDAILLFEGDKIPADCRLIEQNNLKVDNSSITGESEPQLRKLEFTNENILESRNMVFSGTLVQSGNGKAVVYATGMNTQIGNLAKLTKETRNVETPLHKELKHFIKVISFIAILLGTVFFAVSVSIGQQFTGSLIFAIGIIVANVPEGLLPTVTLCLSIASKRMAKKNALIKNLESVETLGSTTVICTDKTGTITENRMKVNTVYLDLKEQNSYDKGIEKTPGFSIMEKIMVYCNNSHFDLQSKKFMGDPTETCLLSFSSRFHNVAVFNDKRVHETPFDPKTKRMISTNISGSRKTAYLKGAPETVLHICNYVLHKNKLKKMTPSMRKDLLSHYEKIASRGERVLAFAYKETKTEKAQEEKFIFIALIGIMDPPREKVPDAIIKCKAAGVKVIMTTGDHGLTAEAIARKVGMIEIEGKSNVFLGEQLDKMNDSKLMEVLKKDNLIFARTNPMHKLRIVKVLQQMGEVVAVTGDGVNDAPALKNADMGVSMGIMGTEVAREASDMVLLDDNFATIVNAIEEGRTIFGNIKKFIAYILTSNVPEILPFIAFVLLAIPLPLTVILILAIDLGTDMLPAIGLGTEKPETDVMHNPPRKKEERLLTPQLLFISYGWVGMLQAAAGFFSFFVILFSGGWVWGQQLAFNNPLYMKAVAGFFASIVICQIADVLICRTRRQSIFNKGFWNSFTGNRIVMFGIIVELLLLSIILYFPPAQAFFGTGPLTLFELSLSIPFALLILFADELRKVFVRNDNKFVKKYLTW